MLPVVANVRSRPSSLEFRAYLLLIHCDRSARSYTPFHLAQSSPARVAATMSVDRKLDFYMRLNHLITYSRQGKFTHTRFRKKSASGKCNLWYIHIENGYLISLNYIYDQYSRFIAPAHSLTLATVCGAAAAVRMSRSIVLVGVYTLRLCYTYLVAQNVD